MEFTSLCSADGTSLSLHVDRIGSLKSTKSSSDMVGVMLRADRMVLIKLALAQLFKKDLAAKIKASQFISCSGLMENDSV